MIKFIEEIIKWGKVSPLYDWFGKRSYAQSGEDIIAWNELKNSRNQGIKNPRQGNVGFYVDIGAFHPKIFSNTYLFYKRGWNGVCVEPNPEAKVLFQMARPRDGFVGVGVGERTQELKNSKTQDNELTYYVFEEGATNTFDKETAKKNIKVGRKLLKTIKVPVMEINDLLKKYVPNGQEIDLLSIDVEGMDEKILRGWDFGRWKPRMIVCEELERTQEIKNPRTQGVEGFLTGKGYELVGMTGYSLVFRLSMVDSR